MNPLIQLKKATPLFGITLVLAWFALSPQAFAQAAPWTFTFTPNQWCGPLHYKNVAISSQRNGVGGGGIVVWMEPDQVCFWISNPGTIQVGRMNPPKTLKAFHTRNPPTQNSLPIFDTGLGNSGTYKYGFPGCNPGKVVFWVIGGILLAAVLISLFVKRSSANR